MPMRKAHFVRLLPLASLVLAACSINAPKGPATSPTSPQWREHEAQVKFTQNGKAGTVVYQSYDDDAKPSLPQRLEMTQGEQRIKLKMDNWTLN